MYVLAARQKKLNHEENHRLPPPPVSNGPPLRVHVAGSERHN